MFIHDTHSRIHDILIIRNIATLCTLYTQHLYGHTYLLLDVYTRFNHTILGYLILRLSYMYSLVISSHKSNILVTFDMTPTCTFVTHIGTLKRVKCAL